uniref:Uncharacterized protein n=1 Tax=Arundo donax TaxID=35708 RepID=A0A0A9GRB2_ARUDO
MSEKCYKIFEHGIDCVNIDQITVILYCFSTVRFPYVEKM